MSFITEDCYWIEVIENKDVWMKAVCINCYEQNKGTFWSKSNGYGDYDLKCYRCKKILHQRNENHSEQEKNETQTSD